MPDEKLHLLIRDAFFQGKLLKRQEPLVCYISRINLIKQVFEISDQTASVKCQFSEECSAIGHHLMQLFKQCEEKKPHQLANLIGCQITIKKYGFGLNPIALLVNDFTIDFEKVWPLSSWPTEE
jgi:hypothetical protein